ncbi:NUDIX hydrolase [Streptomyces sp. NPDC003483]
MTKLNDAGIAVVRGLEDLPPAERWPVQGSRSLYSSRWVSLDLVKVAPPDAEPYEHHVVTVPYEAVGVVVHHPAKGILMLHRHRFITDTVGFEVPAGGIEPGEPILDAARREVLEETGWKADKFEHLLSCNASDGVSTQRFHFVYARAEEYLGAPVDAHESSHLVWIPVDRIASIIRDGQVPGCLSTTALLYALTQGHLAQLV